MAVNPISHVSHVVEILRQRLRTTQPSSPLNSTSDTVYLPPESRKSFKSKEIKKLERSLTTRIASLQQQGDQPFEAIVRLLVEEVLRWEFGEEITQGRRFQELLDNVSNAISRESNLRGKFEEFFAQVRSK